VTHSATGRRQSARRCRAVIRISRVRGSQRIRCCSQLLVVQWSRVKTSYPFAGWQDVVYRKVPAGVQIRRHAPEDAPQIGRCLQMIERVEVCRDEIDPRRQSEAANVLLQETNVRVATIARRLAQHRRRMVNGVHRRVSAEIQITGEEPCPAANVSRRRKPNVDYFARGMPERAWIPG
jgi:hypothetical protein